MDSKSLKSEIAIRVISFLCFRATFASLTWVICYCSVDIYEFLCPLNKGRSQIYKTERVQKVDMRGKLGRPRKGYENQP